MPTSTHRVAARWLTAVAPPAGKVFYHGTDRQAAADSILSEGIRPGKIEQGRSFMAPVKGKVYLTPNLAYGVIYAIGGNVLGHTVPPSFYAKEPYGFLFVVPSGALTDVQPDEDSIGEMVGVSFEPHESQVKYWPHLAGNIPRWLPRLAEQHLTERQISKVREGEAAYYAAAGKKLVKVLSDQQMQEIIEAGAHVANEGAVVPTSCWRVEKSRSAELKKDGSNFFQVAEPYKR